MAWSDAARAAAAEARRRRAQMLFRGTGPGHAGGFSKNPLGTWTSTEQRFAARYGKVVQYRPVRTYGWTNKHINAALSKAAGFQIHSGQDLTASVDEASQGAKVVIAKLRQMRYAALRVNQEEAGVFVFDSKKLKRK